MSIQIREIEVVASINSDTERRENAPASSGELDELKKEIIAESVERVLSIIQNQKER
jgi:hypothetical protein